MPPPSEIKNPQTILKTAQLLVNNPRLLGPLLKTHLPSSYSLQLHMIYIQLVKSNSGENINDIIAAYEYVLDKLYMHYNIFPVVVEYYELLAHTLKNSDEQEFICKVRSVFHRCLRNPVEKLSDLFLMYEDFENNNGPGGKNNLNEINAAYLNSNKLLKMYKIKGVESVYEGDMTNANVKFGANNYAGLIDLELKNIMSLDKTDFVKRMRFVFEYLCDKFFDIEEVYIRYAQFLVMHKLDPLPVLKNGISMTNSTMIVVIYAFYARDDEILLHEIQRCCDELKGRVLSVNSRSNIDDSENKKVCSTIDNSNSRLDNTNNRLDNSNNTIDNTNNNNDATESVKNIGNVCSNVDNSNNKEFLFKKIFNDKSKSVIRQKLDTFSIALLNLRIKNGLASFRETFHFLSKMPISENVVVYAAKAEFYATGRPENSFKIFSNAIKMCQSKDESKGNNEFKNDKDSEKDKVIPSIENLDIRKANDGNFNVKKPNTENKDPNDFNVNFLKKEFLNFFLTIGSDINARNIYNQLYIKEMDEIMGVYEFKYGSFDTFSEIFGLSKNPYKLVGKCLEAENVKEDIEVFLNMLPDLGKEFDFLKCAANAIIDIFKKY